MSGETRLGFRKGKLTGWWMRLEYPGGGKWKLGASENFPGHAAFSVLFVGDRDGILVGGGYLREG